MTDEYRRAPNLQFEQFLIATGMPQAQAQQMGLFFRQVADNLEFFAQRPEPEGGEITQPTTIERIRYRRIHGLNLVAGDYFFTNSTQTDDILSWSALVSRNDLGAVLHDQDANGRNLADYYLTLKAGDAMVWQDGLRRWIAWRLSAAPASGALGGTTFFRFAGSPAFAVDGSGGTGDLTTARKNVIWGFSRQDVTGIVVDPEAPQPTIIERVRYRLFSGAAGRAGEYFFFDISSLANVTEWNDLVSGTSINLYIRQAGTDGRDLSEYYMTIKADDTVMWEDSDDRWIAWRVTGATTVSNGIVRFRLDGQQSISADSRGGNEDIPVTAHNIKFGFSRQDVTGLVVEPEEVQPTIIERIGFAEMSATIGSPGEYVFEDSTDGTILTAWNDLVTSRSVRARLVAQDVDGNDLSAYYETLVEDDTVMWEDTDDRWIAWRLSSDASVSGADEAAVLDFTGAPSLSADGTGGTSDIPSGPNPVKFGFSRQDVTGLVPTIDRVQPAVIERFTYDLKTALSPVEDGSYRWVGADGNEVSGWTDLVAASDLVLELWQADTFQNNLARYLLTIIPEDIVIWEETPKRWIAWEVTKQAVDVSGVVRISFEGGSALVWDSTDGAQAPGGITGGGFARPAQITFAFSRADIRDKLPVPFDSVVTYDDRRQATIERGHYGQWMPQNEDGQVLDRDPLDWNAVAGIRFSRRDESGVDRSPVFESDELAEAGNRVSIRRFTGDGTVSIIAFSPSGGPVYRSQDQSYLMPLARLASEDQGDIRKVLPPIGDEYDLQVMLPELTFPPPRFAEIQQDLTFVTNVAIDPVQLPPANGGDGELSYSLSELPAGLRFDDVSREISGTAAAAGQTLMVLVATDTDLASASLAFLIDVVLEAADAMPAFISQQVDISLVRGIPMAVVTLPGSSHGDLPLTYIVSALPGGIEFDASTRELSGTPTVQGSFTVVYTVRDVDGDTDTQNFGMEVGQGADAPGRVGTVTPTAGPQMITLAFDPPANGGSAITHYFVQWKSGSEDYDSERQARVTESPVEIGNLAVSRLHTFRVAAANVVGVGPWSLEARATPVAGVPGKVTRFTTTQNRVSSTRSSLRWTFEPPDNDGGRAIGHYEGDSTTQTDTQGNPVFSSPQRIGASSRWWGIGVSLRNATRFWFHVRAVNGTGAGEWSDAIPIDYDPTISHVLDLVQPDLRIESNGAAATADLSPASGGAALNDGVLTYAIARRDGSDLPSGLSLSHRTITAPANSGPVTLELEATVTDAASNTASDDFDLFYDTLTKTVPSRITDLAGTAGDGQATLTWSAPASGGSPILRYEIQWRAGTNEFDPVRAQTVAAMSPATVRGLAAGTAHQFRIRAVNAVGPGPWPSALVAVTPTGAASALALSLPDLRARTNGLAWRATLNAPTGGSGDGTLASVTSPSALPDGIMITLSTRVVEVPAEAVGDVDITIEASDTAGGSASDSFNLDYDTRTPAPEMEFSLTQPNVTLDSGGRRRGLVTTLQAARNAAGSVIYSLAGLPSGAGAPTFSPARRQLTAVAGSSGQATVTYTATDTANETDSARFVFKWYTHSALRLSQGNVTISGDDAAATRTLAAASGGDGTYSYSLSGLAAADGSFSGRTVTIKRGRSGAANTTYRVTDRFGKTATQTVRISFNTLADTVPLTIGNPEDIDISSEGIFASAIITVTASGGDGTYHYLLSVTGDLPDGVSFDAELLLFTFQARHSGRFTAVLHVSDGAGATAMSEEFTVTFNTLSPPPPPPLAISQPDIEIISSNGSHGGYSLLKLARATGGTPPYDYVVDAAPPVIVQNLSNRLAVKVGLHGTAACRLAVTDNAGGAASDFFDCVYDTRPIYTIYAGTPSFRRFRRGAEETMTATVSGTRAYIIRVRVLITGPGASTQTVEAIGSQSTRTLSVTYTVPAAIPPDRTNYTANCYVWIRRGPEPESFERLLTPTDYTLEVEWTDEDGFDDGSELLENPTLIGLKRFAAGPDPRPS